MAITLNPISKSSEISVSFLPKSSESSISLIGKSSSSASIVTGNPIGLLLALTYALDVGNTDMTVTLISKN